MSDTNLYAAHRQWATRPADERFWNLAEMYAKTLEAANAGRTLNTSINRCRAVAVDDDIRLQTPEGELEFSNWSFSQFANRIGAPGYYLASLPSDVSARALNVGIQKQPEDDNNLQIWYDDRTKISRAITSQSYNRIFNHEIIAALQAIPGNWVTPPARPVSAGMPGSRLATEEDCKSSTLIRPGDLIAPAGLYASDRDMFAFMVDPDTRIDDGSEEGLSRGFFVRNSEVGNAVFEIVTFLYRYVCGNHIVWGASKVEQLKVKHLGSTARQRAFDKIAIKLNDYRIQSAQDETARIKLARQTEIAPTFDEMSDLLYGKKIMARADIKQAYDIANQYADIDGSPRSFWGFASGVTRLSQNSPNTDRRDKLDRAAGQILAMVN